MAESKIKPEFTLTLDKPLYFDHDVVHMNLKIHSERPDVLFFPGMKVMVANVFRDSSQKKTRNLVLFSKNFKLGDLEVSPGTENIELDFNLPEDIMPSSFESELYGVFWEVTLTFQVENHPLVILAQQKFRKSTIYVNMKDGKTSTRKSFDILGKSEVDVELSTSTSITSADKAVEYLMTITSAYHSLAIQKMKVTYRQNVKLTNKKGEDIVSFSSDLDRIYLDKTNTTFEYNEADLSNSTSQKALSLNNLSPRLMSPKSPKGSPIGSPRDTRNFLLSSRSLSSLCCQRESPPTSPRSPIQRSNRPYSCDPDSDRTTAYENNMSLDPLATLSLDDHIGKNQNKNSCSTTCTMGPKVEKHKKLRKAWKNLSINTSDKHIAKACHQEIDLINDPSGHKNFLVPSISYTANHNGMTLSVTYELICKVTTIGALVDKLHLPITLSVADSVAKDVWGEDIDRMLDHVQFHENEDPPVFDEVEIKSDELRVLERDANELEFSEGCATEVKAGKYHRYLINPTGGDLWAYSGRIDQLRARAYTLPKRIHGDIAKTRKKMSLSLLKGMRKSTRLEPEVHISANDNLREDTDDHSRSDNGTVQSDQSTREKRFMYIANQVYGIEGDMDTAQASQPWAPPVDSRACAFGKRYNPTTDAILSPRNIPTSPNSKRLTQAVPPLASAIHSRHVSSTQREVSPYPAQDTLPSYAELDQ
eukprot:CFRG0365T1